MSTSEKQQGPIAMTEDTLLKLVEAMRKPVKTEEQIRAEEQAKRDREIMGDLLKQQEANRKAEQDACTHIRFNGTTSAVYIHNGNYMLCQHCQKVIKPAEEPELFNKLIRLSNYAGF